jgi:hypothetical protein
MDHGRREAMKKLLLLLVIVVVALIMCSQQGEMTPMDCYYVKLTASTIDGHIISTTSDYVFTYDAAFLEKWNSEAVKVTRDTNNHTVTIEMRQCVLPDTKDMHKYFTE